MSQILLFCNRPVIWRFAALALAAVLPFLMLIAYRVHARMEPETGQSIVQV